MIVLDANLLLYAYDAASVHHVRAKAWLEKVLLEGDLVRLPWVTILAFLRITTNYRAVAVPLTEARACGIVSALLARPSVSVLESGPRHWEIFSRLIQQSGCKGPLVTDAHLAALAMEHGAILCTHDRDFLRFSGLRVEFPLAETDAS